MRGCREVVRGPRHPRRCRPVRSRQRPADDRHGPRQRGPLPGQAPGAPDEPRRSRPRREHRGLVRHRGCRRREPRTRGRDRSGTCRPAARPQRAGAGRLPIGARLPVPGAVATAQRRPRAPPASTALPVHAHAGRAAQAGRERRRRPPAGRDQGQALHACAGHGDPCLPRRAGRAVPRRPGRRTPPPRRRHRAVRPRPADDPPVRRRQRTHRPSADERAAAGLRVRRHTGTSRWRRRSRGPPTPTTRRCSPRPTAGTTPGTTRGRGCGTS